MISAGDKALLAVVFDPRRIKAASPAEDQLRKPPSLILGENSAHCLRLRSDGQGITHVFLPPTIDHEKQVGLRDTIPMLSSSSSSVRLLMSNGPA